MSTEISFATAYANPARSRGPSGSDVDDFTLSIYNPTAGVITVLVSNQDGPPDVNTAALWSTFSSNTVGATSNGLLTLPASRFFKVDHATAAPAGSTIFSNRRIT